MPISPRKRSSSSSRGPRPPRDPSPASLPQSAANNGSSAVLLYEAASDDSDESDSQHHHRHSRPQHHHRPGDSAFRAVSAGDTETDLDLLDPAAGTPFSLQQPPLPKRGSSSLASRLRSVLPSGLATISPAGASAATGGKRSPPSRHGFQRLPSDVGGQSIPMHATNGSGRGTPLHPDPSTALEVPASPTMLHHHGGPMHLPPLDQWGAGLLDHLGFNHDSTLRWTERLYQLMENPASSQAAFYVSIAVSFCIVSASVLACLETVPAFYASDVALWDARQAIELFIIAFFTIEYILRCLARSHSIWAVGSFLRSPLSLVDLLAIVPYYFELATSSSDRPLPGETASDSVAAHMSAVFRFTLLRTFRLFRLFRVFRHVSLVQFSIDVLIIALKKSLDQLVALGLLVSAVVAFFSLLFFFAERGQYDPALRAFVDANGRPSKFDSIPASAFFVLTTLSTTGYGDIIPMTAIGRVIASAVMLIGILLIAIPSILVGRNYVVVFEYLKAERGLRARQLGIATAMAINVPPRSPALPTDPNTPASAAAATPETSAQRTTTAAVSPPSISPGAVDVPVIPATSRALFEDPFSIGGIGTSVVALGPMPTDARDLVAYIASVSGAIAAHQRVLDEAVARLADAVAVEGLLVRGEQQPGMVE
ncbi:hypothetical protein BC828DRAFT_197068 [Blastocladiella britannica]|nr:hypothetical protein BC828DRAFT_197068 [Blastocladiella britannica]